MMNYQEALEYLASLGKFGMNLGLARIEKLTAMLDHPERRFKTIHVTGTNGKGSTAAMLSAALGRAGIRTGMYISPHLNEYTERMTVNGEEVSRDDFASAVERVAGHVESMIKEGWDHPTEFEVITAAAFHYFAEAKVEYAVIEVGLGGLLDSTNVITPEVAVITNVTLEHTDRCGNTVAEIAKHKAGIIKPGAKVVTAAHGEALAVIEAEAAAKAAPLYVLGRDFTAQAGGIEAYRQKVIFSRTGETAFEPLVITLLGRHQVENCAVAVMAALALAETEPRLTIEAIRKGLAEAVWHGRFEVVDGKPPLVIDGAHNPAGAISLRTTLDEVFPGRDIVFALGILADKDIDGIIGALIRPGDSVVTVRPDSGRAAEPEEVAARIAARRVEAADSIAAGLNRAKELAGPDGVVCVAGSLYLIGEARKLVRE